MIKLALTGMIAMGKSVTGRFFAQHGVPVFDSDATVHDLYGAGAPGSLALAEIIPEAIRDGRVDLGVLSASVQADPLLLPKVEAVIHPMVRARCDQFFTAATHAGVPFAIADIPLLFETGRQAEFDRVFVVSATPEQQRQRALARPGMTPAKLDYILSRQIPDDEKRRRADVVIDTSASLADVEAQVTGIIASLLKEQNEHGHS